MLLVLLSKTQSLVQTFPRKKHCAAQLQFQYMCFYCRAFRCRICLDIPKRPIVLKCCGVLGGCVGCYETLTANPHAACPNCRGARVIANMLELRGLDSVMNEITAFTSSGNRHGKINPLFIHSPRRVFAAISCMTIIMLKPFETFYGAAIHHAISVSGLGNTDDGDDTDTDTLPAL